MRPDILWILGAPTMNFYREHIYGGRFDKIVVCASLDTFRKSLNTSETNVYQLPTNLRTHTGPTAVTMGSIFVHDKESFCAAQEDTSNAWLHILKYASINDTPVYFAIVPRVQRPTYLNGDLTTNADTNALSQRILNELVIPAYGTAAQVEGAMKQACSHNATYLADVLTVGCMLTNSSTWTSFNVSGMIVRRDGLFLDGGRGFEGLSTLSEVPYVYAEFEEHSGGLVKEFKTECVEDLKTALGDALDTSGKSFNRSVVLHDALLNDIDDLPAMRLIEKLSLEYEKVQNYTPYSEALCRI